MNTGLFFLAVVGMPEQFDFHTNVVNLIKTWFMYADGTKSNY